MALIGKKKSAVISRFFERGNEDEIYELIRFYGKNIILNSLKFNTGSITAQTIQKYLS
jgi:hypothetical protein